ncbi:MAG: BON domain-containing protein [Longimicrobiales bacterium]
MAEDYEDIDDLESLEDGELRDLILERLNDYPALDTDLVEVAVADGRVTLSGRVGTERELQEFEHVLTDVIGVTRVENGIVVDELVRAEYPEPADEAAEVHAADKGPTGAGADRTEDSAEHLMRDTAAEQFGTDSVSEAVERGYAYDPPDQPIQEGTDSRENH